MADTCAMCEDDLTQGNFVLAHDTGYCKPCWDYYEDLMSYDPDRDGPLEEDGPEA